MATWHTPCYIAYQKALGNETNTKGRYAKYSGQCAGVYTAGGKCLADGRIQPSQSITWDRSKKPEAVPAASDSATAFEAETFASKAEFNTAKDENVLPDATTKAPYEEDMAKARHVKGADPSSSPVVPAVTTAALPDLGALGPILEGLLGGVIDARLASKLDKAIQEIREAAGTSRKVEVKIGESGTYKDMGRQHKSFETLLKMVASGTEGHPINVWLAGPSGSGKTHAAHAVADAMSLPFYYSGAVSDAYALLGYKDAHGNYVPTLCREAYENGGVFLFDEVDGSDPTATLALNAMLANGHAAFPDKLIRRHKDCRVIAAANTWGHGATREYVGRNKLDTAFLKRFAFMNWSYDEELERETCGNPTWAKRVQHVRKAVEKKGLRVLVTPRESYIGSQLLAAGLDQETVEAATIRSGMTDEQWAQVSA
jgi:hypothetical protein